MAYTLKYESGMNLDAEYENADVDNHRYERVATPQEACREYAYTVGSEHQDRPWILTNYDTWERNPYYRSPEGYPYPPLPDCEEWEMESWEASMWCPIRPAKVADPDEGAARFFDDLPF
jgi:hypothetical protein